MELFLDESDHYKWRLTRFNWVEERFDAAVPENRKSSKSLRKLCRGLLEIRCITSFHFETIYDFNTSEKPSFGRFRKQYGAQNPQLHDIDPAAPILRPLFSRACPIITPSDKEEAGP